LEETAIKSEEPIPARAKISQNAFMQKIPLAELPPKLSPDETFPRRSTLSGEQAHKDHPYFDIKPYSQYKLSPKKLLIGVAVVVAIIVAISLFSGPGLRRGDQNHRIPDLLACRSQTVKGASAAIYAGLERMASCR
jgi:hypothetical protein